MAGHGHHHHDVGHAGDSRVIWAVAVNLGLTIVQIVGGLLSGSLALIADALHNLSDAGALAIAVAARRIARRPADAQMTFGYGRAEIVAALINYTTLIVIGIYLIYEGVSRLFAPEPVAGWIVVWIALAALVVDLVTAALTWAMSKDSVNIRAAFLHNIADAAGSVGVIVAGTLILVFGWTWADPVATLLIAGYIIWMSLGEMGGVIRILMLASPDELDVGEIARAIGRMRGVDGMHHAHLWMMGEHDRALDAHLVISAGDWHRADTIKDEVRAVLAESFEIRHSTLEIECAAHVCHDTSLIRSH